MVTKASQWKSKSKTGEHVLPLPSGNECKARGIKPETFLESGMIPDPLTAMIQKAISSKRGLPPTAMSDISEDPAKLASAMEMFDRVLCYAVIEPAVEMPPVCTVEGCAQLEFGGEGVHVKRSHPKYHRFVEGEREDGILYADVVDMEDKQFIFQWAIGGVSDVNRFREQLSATLGAVPEVGDVPDTTE